MPIVAHPKLPSLSKLKAEGLIVADASSLAKEFHQELRIGLLNLMPDAALQATERQFIRDRKSTRLNSSHVVISYAVFCLKKKK